MFWWYFKVRNFCVSQNYDIIARDEILEINLNCIRWLSSPSYIFEAQLCETNQLRLILFCFIVYLKVWNLKFMYHSGLQTLTNCETFVSAPEFLRNPCEVNEHFWCKNKKSYLDKNYIKRHKVFSILKGKKVKFTLEQTINGPEV
jgi:hypothetical protein